MAGLLSLGSAAAAQEAAIKAPNLGAGYAQFINISLSEDMSAANYQLDASAGVSDPRLRIARLPWRFASTGWGPVKVDGELLFGYLDLKVGFPISVPAVGEGKIDAEWMSYGLTLGAIFRIPLTETLSLEPAVRLGVARLHNDAQYSGAAELFRPYTDGVLFNWTMNASVTSPSLALTSRRTWGRTETLLTGHVAHSRVVSFDESNESLAFRKGANTVSLKGELESPSDWSVGGRAVRVLGLAGYARFFGENSDAMGFNNIVEVGGGLSFPLGSPAERDRRVRLSASLLRGQGVRGWAVGLGLKQW